MIKCYRDGKFCEMSSLRKAMGLEQVSAPVIAAVGGGGKTTTLGRLAQEYAESGEQAIVLTTTHMREETASWFCVAEEAEWLSKETAVLDQIQEKLKQYHQVWIGTRVQNGKISCVPEQVLKIVEGWKLPLLVEADGARMLPLKVPAADEPVILPQTTHVLSVYGMDALGQKLEEICFRSEIAAELLGKQGTDLVIEEDIARLACHEEGGKKGCPEQAEYIVILNKADTRERQEQAERIAKYLAENGVKRILITSHRDRG